MKVLSRVAATLTIISASIASPAKRRSDYVFDDTAVLNFALTLEHLEVAFYQEGLTRFDEAAFAAVGLPAFTRGRIVQISENEQTHVRVLSEVIGPDATKPCNYSFPLTDARSFVDLSAIFEGVGSAAYAGAANLLSDPTHLMEAASILATEARQAAWVNSAVRKQNPWSTPFETPLNLSQAFSLATGFITSCPSTNPSLPVSTFPSLNVTNTSYVAGGPIALSFDSGPTDDSTTSADTQLFLALLTGLRQLFVSLEDSGNGTWSATLPSDLQGTVYALVSNIDGDTSDDNIVAGLAILQFPFDSQAHIINATNVLI